MMEFASRPLPSSKIAFDQPLVLRSKLTTPAPTLPLPRPSLPFGQLSDYSIRTNDARTLANFSIQNTSVPPITHAKDSVRELQTPTQKMATADARPPPPQSNGHGYYKPFDNPISSSEVSKRLERMRNTTLEQQQQQKQAFLAYQQATTPPRRAGSAYPIPAQQQPSRQNGSPVRTGAAMLVPTSINTTGASIADFAAQIICLFWFESANLLQTIEESSTPIEPSLLQPLAHHAVPETGFRKWVNMIIATTQVSMNVILLALLFVHRLKRLNPSVQGNPGSEFRLFTVALMLSNKYLDDNTYTNKTWAEVSGINVQEIHVMEVEFLSNMRYSLYVESSEWIEWTTKLGRFWAYWDKGSKLPLAPRPPPSPDAAVASQPTTAPTRRSLPPASTRRPLPPVKTGTSPPYINTHAPANSIVLPAPLDPPLQFPQLPMPPPDFDSFSRKRSLDYSNAMQPPNKRVARSPGPNLSVNVPQFPVSVPPIIPQTSAPVPPILPQTSAPVRFQPLDYSQPKNPPRSVDTLPSPYLPHPMNLPRGADLPPPYLPQPTNPPRSVDTLPSPYLSHPMNPPRSVDLPPPHLPMNPPRILDALPSSHLPQPQHPQLPLPGTRSTYSQPTSSLNLSPAAPGPPTHFNFSPYSTRQTSPYSAHHSVSSSPNTPSFGSQHSPTWVLGNRESPYRPVRTVNTLLVPPVHMEAPLQVPYDNMQYHPLAKVRSEYKTGPVPYVQSEVSWSHPWSDNNNNYYG